MPFPVLAASIAPASRQALADGIAKESDWLQPLLTPKTWRVVLWSPAAPPAPAHQQRVAKEWQEQLNKGFAVRILGARLYPLRLDLAPVARKSATGGSSCTFSVRQSLYLQLGDEVAAPPKSQTPQDRQAIRDQANRAIVRLLKSAQPFVLALESATWQTLPIAAKETAVPIPQQPQPVAPLGSLPSIPEKGTHAAATAVASAESPRAVSACQTTTTTTTPVQTHPISMTDQKSQSKFIGVGKLVRQRQALMSAEDGAVYRDLLAWQYQTTKNGLDVMKTWPDNPWVTGLGTDEQHPEPLFWQWVMRSSSSSSNFSIPGLRLQSDRAITFDNHDAPWGATKTAMSLAHLLVIPKNKRLYNILTLQEKHQSLVQHMVQQGGQALAAGFREIVCLFLARGIVAEASRPPGFEPRYSLWLRPAELSFMETLRQSAVTWRTRMLASQQSKVDAIAAYLVRNLVLPPFEWRHVRTYFHVAPYHSIGQLHLHVIYAPWTTRAYDRHRPQMTSGGVALRVLSQAGPRP